jgi:Winged helix DNA-binding domain
MTTPPIPLGRAQILGHRLRAGILDERRPPGPDSLREAAFAGLTDSMPRAALLSIHARVARTAPDAWADPALAQVWGPRFSAYVVPADAVAPFTLGRLPDDPGKRALARDTADRLEAFLAGRTMTYGEAGRALGRNPNSLRYAAPTGRVRIRWEGARQPTIWTVPAPDVDPHDARLDLARRYLHVLGPATPAAFEAWAGIRAPGGRSAFRDLGDDLKQVRTPIGDGWILASDEPSFRRSVSAAAAVTEGAAVRLLPSGDAYWLL